MAKAFCPDKHATEYKELVQVLGSPEMAHLVWDKNGGFPLDFNPKGEKSILYQSIIDYTEDDKFAALRLKAQYYLDTNPNGKWWENFEREPSFVVPQVEEDQAQIERESQLKKKAVRTTRSKNVTDVKDIAQKFADISKDIIEETDVDVIKELHKQGKGHMYYMKDGSREYLTGIGRRMAKYGFGYSGPDTDTIYTRVGKTLHGHIEDIQNEIIADLGNKYGVALTKQAKEDLADIFKQVKGKYTALSEVVIPDLEQGLVGKIDLVLISETGKVMLVDFKSKLRGTYVDKDGTSHLKGSGFNFWNKPYGSGIHSDRDKVHLQLSIYAHMVEKVLGLDVESISVVKLDAHSNDEGKTIHTVEAFGATDVSVMESFYDKKDKLRYHDSTQGVYYGDTAYLHNKTMENIERELRDDNEKLYDKIGVTGTTKDLMNKLKKDLVVRLKFAKKRFDYDKRQELEKVVANVFEAENATDALYEIISYSSQEIFDIVDQLVEYRKNGKDFTPGILYRWKDAIQGFKSLYWIKNELKEKPDLIPNKDYRKLLLDATDEIEHLENLYKQEGRYLIAKWLTPYYNGIRVKFEDIYKAEYRRLKHQEVKRAKRSLDQFEEQYGDINEYVNTRVKSDIVYKDTYDMLYKELETASRDIGELTRWLDNMLDTTDPVAAAMVNALTQIEEKSRVEAIDMRADMMDLLEELQMTHKKSAMQSEEDFYGFMLEHDAEGKPTQYIVKPYKSSFFADAEEIRKTERKSHPDEEVRAAVKAFKKEHSAFNADEFRQGSLDYLNELFTTNQIDVKEYNQILEYIMYSESFFITDIKANEVVKEETVQKFSYWFSKNSPLFYDYDEAYTNPEWKKLMTMMGIDASLSSYKQMQELKKSKNSYAKFYAGIEDISRKANQVIPIGYRIYDRLPGVQKLTSERLLSGQSPLDMAKENLKTGFFVRPDDVERGNQEWTNEQGRVKYYIPINYTAKVDAIDQSYDLASIYFKFWESANDFKNKRNVLPEMEMTRFFINERKTYKRNVFGKMLKNSMGDDDELDMRSLKDKTVLADMFNDWFEMAVYGKMTKDLKDPIKITDTLAFDPMKFVDAINRYTSLNLLSLNVVQGFANVAMGEFMQSVEAVAHEYVNPITYSKAMLRYDAFLPGVLNDLTKTLPTSLGGLIYEEFNVLDESVTDVSFSTTTRLGKLARNTSTFAMQHMGEHFLQNRFLLAMLLNKKVVDLEGNQIGSILDQYTKVKDRLQLKQQSTLTPEQFQKFLEKNKWTEKDQMLFKIKIRGILSRMHGEYSDLGRVALQRLAVGRMVYMFRKFVMPGFRRRWGREAYSQRLGQVTEGNYITFLKFFRNYYKEIGTLQFSLMSENWAALSDHEKANIHRTIAEAAFLTATLIIGAFFFKMKGDADPDDEWLYAFLAYQSYRLKSEILFFTSPGNAMQILRSPMASMSIIQNITKLGAQLTNPTELYQRGPMKGEYKLKKDVIDMVPMIKQFYRARDIEQQINWFKGAGGRSGNFQ